MLFSLSRLPSPDGLPHLVAKIRTIMVNPHAHFYIKLAAICACIGAVNYALYRFYRERLPTSTYSEYQAPSDAYTTALKEAERRVKENPGSPDLGIAPFVRENNQYKASVNYMQIYDIQTSPDAYTTATREAIRRIKENRDNLNHSVITPFVNENGQFRVAPKYNLAACLNEKVMCTLTQAVFCYLYDTEGFTAQNKSIFLERWYPRFCERRNEIHGAKELHLRYPQKLPTLYMVRDPLEKFLSGYSNKCLLENANMKRRCYGCLMGDVLCAVEGLHAEITKKSNWNSSSNEPPPELGLLTNHLLPSIWRCEMFEQFENYIFVKYGETPEDEAKMWETILKIFEAHGVEETKLKHINDVVHKRSLMATKSRPEREEITNKLKSSEKHMQLLRDIYYYDYLAFGYQLL